MCQISQLRSGSPCATATEINEEHQKCRLLTHPGLPSPDPPPLPVFTGHEQDKPKNKQDKRLIVQGLMQAQERPKTISGGLSGSSSFNCFLSPFLFLFFFFSFFFPSFFLQSFQKAAASQRDKPACCSWALLCVPSPTPLKLGSNKELSIMLLLFKTIPDK